MNDPSVNNWKAAMHRVLENEDKPDELERKTTLESLNDDCLRYIFKHLNLLEAANVAATCTRLQNFAIDSIFPRSAKEIQLKLLSLSDGIPTSSVGLLCLKDHFKSFGLCVKRLDIVASNNTNFGEIFILKDDIKKILVLCPNLETLTFDRVKFLCYDILKYVTPNLKEIKFIYSEIPKYWCDALKQLNSATFIGGYGGDDFLKQNTTISSLTFAGYTEKDLELFFNLNGRSLTNLRLIHFRKYRNYELIATLIADKLPELQNLAIEDILSETLTNSLSKLPHLKSLTINCIQYNAIALLETLSDRDTIENLDITDFVIGDNEKPLIFNQLRRLSCSNSSSPMLQAFLCLITKSHMPAIKFLDVNSFEIEVQYILKLFESKKSLETLAFHCVDDASAIPLLCGIIEILKADPNRPYLTLHIPSLKSGTKEVSNTKHKYCVFSILKYSRIF